MIQTVHMVCGVPGSGKSWVCEQLTDKFKYIKHDDYIKPLRLKDDKMSEGDKDFIADIIKAAKGKKPVLIDCPFGERDLRAKIQLVGLTVKPWFIVEKAEVVKSRYQSRTGRELPMSSVTRCETIMNRVAEWDAPHGPALAVLNALRREVGLEPTK